MLAFGTFALVLLRWNEHQDHALGELRKDSNAKLRSKLYAIDNWENQKFLSDVILRIQTLRLLPAVYLREASHFFDFQLL